MPIDIRYTIPYVIVGFLAPVGAWAQAPQAMTLPEIRSWCAHQSLAKDQADTESAVDAAKEASAKAIDDALVAAGVPYSGLPFVASMRKVTTPNPAAGGATSETLEFDVCVSVAPTAIQVAPASISVRTFPAASYEVAVCDGNNDADCISDLRKAMFLSLGSEKKEAIYSSMIIVTAIAAGTDPQSVSTAFQSGADRSTVLSSGSVGGTGLSNVDLHNTAQRPLLLNSEAALIVNGAPIPGHRIIAIAIP